MTDETTEKYPDVVFVLLVDWRTVEPLLSRPLPLSPLNSG